MIRRKSFVCITAFALLALFGQYASAVVIPKTFFGMHIHGRVDVLHDQAASIQSWRLHDTFVAWWNLQPEQHVWRFERLDAIVQAAGTRGISLVLPLGFPPTWAATDPQKLGAYGAGSSSPPRDTQHWRDYVRTVVRRYAGRVQYYEIWNEPDIPKFFSGSHKELADLTNVACDEIRKHDPLAMIISPSVNASRVNYLNAYFPMVRRNCIDVVGIHFYTNHGPPELIGDLVPRVKAAVSSAGLADRPIWNTESGWLISNPKRSASPEEVGFLPGARVLSRGEAINYMIRAHLIAASAGIQRFYWYAWDNAQMGLNTPELQEEYRALVQVFASLTEIRCSSGNVAWECDLIGPSGKTMKVLWSLNGPKTWRSRSAVRMGKLRLDGCTEDVVGRTLVITETPILVCN